MELESPLQPGQRQQAVRQIREIFSSIDALVNQRVGAVSAHLESVQNENKRSRLTYVQQEQKIRELCEQISKRSGEMQKISHDMLRTERKFELKTPEQEETDDRLLQVRILQHKLSVAQEELDAKEAILQKFREGINEGFQTLGGYNQSIVNVEARMSSMGITEGNSTRSDVQLLDEKIKRMEQKLLLAEMCMTDLNKIANIGQRKPRQSGLGRSASAVSSGQHSATAQRYDQHASSGLPPQHPASQHHHNSGSHYTPNLSASNSYVYSHPTSFN
eukprot:TRINITY_DN657_c0_g2_i1.p1 TRINITY_DN657_c0_g2~~TRINITY_DN657_c0_g2_i1.p1  ORF type:complete len:275 (-),score=73.70 TRINITY_DN657_c0_g2_i1:159-983(-)